MEFQKYDVVEILEVCPLSQPNSLIGLFGIVTDCKYSDYLGEVDYLDVIVSYNNSLGIFGFDSSQVKSRPDLVCSGIEFFNRDSGKFTVSRWG